MCPQVGFLIKQKGTMILISAVCSKTMELLWEEKHPRIHTVLSQLPGIRWRGNGEMGGMVKFCDSWGQRWCCCGKSSLGQGRYLMRFVAMTEQLWQEAERVMLALKPWRGGSTLNGAFTSWDPTFSPSCLAIATLHLQIRAKIKILLLGSFFIFSENSLTPHAGI